MSDHPDSIRNDTNSLTLSRQVMLHTKDSDFVVLLNAISTCGNQIRINEGMCSVLAKHEFRRD